MNKALIDKALDLVRNPAVLLYMYIFAAMKMSTRRSTNNCQCDQKSNLKRRKNVANKHSCCRLPKSIPNTFISGKTPPLLPFDINGRLCGLEVLCLC